MIFYDFVFDEPVVYHSLERGIGPTNSQNPVFYCREDYTNEFRRGVRTKPQFTKESLLLRRQAS